MGKSILVPVCCFRCGALKIYRCGKRKGEQCFRCLECHKTFFWPPKVEKPELPTVSCPKCGSYEVWRHGYRQGQKSYRCKICGRCFITQYSPRVSDYKKKLILEFLKLGVPGQKIADIVECGISTVSKERKLFKELGSVELQGDQGVKGIQNE